MPRIKANGRAGLLRELSGALNEVDSLQRDLRAAKKRVTSVMRKLTIHVRNKRNTRGGAASAE